MPIFFQHQINSTTRLGIWKIEETEEFFLHNVPLHRDVTHPHKRLQHLAGRFLLQFLFPGFPHELIQVADTRKPFLPNEQYHFSISHCGDFAAAIVSKTERVGIDIEIPVAKILKVQRKFLSPSEANLLKGMTDEVFDDGRGESTADFYRSTLVWSAKEAVFKWYGFGSVDFKQHILLNNINQEEKLIQGHFTKNNTDLAVHYAHFDQLVLAWIAQ